MFGAIVGDDWLAVPGREGTDGTVDVSMTKSRSLFVYCLLSIKMMFCMLNEQY